MNQATQHDATSVDAQCLDARCPGLVHRSPPVEDFGAERMVFSLSTAE